MIELKDQIIVFGTTFLGVIVFLTGFLTTWISIENSLMVTVLLFVLAGSYGRFLGLSNHAKDKLFLVLEALIILLFTQWFINFSLENVDQNNNLAQFGFIIVIVIFYWLGTGIKTVLGIIDEKKIILINNKKIALPNYASSFFSKANQGHSSVSEQIYINEINYRRKDDKIEY